MTGTPDTAQNSSKHLNILIFRCSSIEYFQHIVSREILNNAMETNQKKKKNRLTRVL